jgi:hypothetical protein
MRTTKLEPFLCNAVIVLVLSIAGSPAALANSIHRHHSPAEAGAAIDQLMLLGDSAPLTQPVESRSRRSVEDADRATDNAATFSPSSLSSLDIPDTPIDTGTLSLAPGNASPRLHHRQSFNVTSSVDDPSPVSTVLDSIPTFRYGGHHHPGEVIRLQSGPFLDSPFSGADTEGLRVRSDTPLGGPLPGGPSPVPEPGSLGLTLAALAVAGIAFRKATAKA